MCHTPTGFAPSTYALPGANTPGCDKPPLRGSPFPIHHFPFSISHSPFPIHHFPLSISHCPLSISHFPLSIVHFPLSIVHFPFPISHFPLSLLYLPLYITLAFLTACSSSSDAKKGGAVLPASKGLPYELTLLVPKPLYSGELRDTLDAILRQSTPGLP